MFIKAKYSQQDAKFFHAELDFSICVKRYGPENIVVKILPVVTEIVQILAIRVVVNHPKNI